MANQGVEYLRELWDSLVHGKRNKERKNDAVREIEDFLQAYEYEKVPEKPELPDVPSYDRLTYEAPTDEQIEKEAEKTLSAYKAQGEKNVDAEIKALSEKYNADIASTNAAQDAAREKAEADYAQAKKNTDNDMLKRGLARSSIAAGKKAALEESEAQEKTRLAAQYGEKIDELNRKISALDVQREQALGDFNLAYAAKLTEKINDLRTERDKKATEVQKYNNTLTEKEYNAAVDKQMKESDLYGEALSQREKENKLREESSNDTLAIYNVIAEKLRGINKNDARDVVLNNPNVIKAVGDRYYYKLYDEFCR